MKKLLLYFCVLISVISLFSGCNGSEKKNAEKLYKQFMNNKVMAVDDRGTAKSFDEYWLRDAELQEYRYTYLDMTGDGVPELCINQLPGMRFFTVKDGEIHHWYTEQSVYSRLLNNGAFLFEQYVSEPPHTNYGYYKLDENAKLKFSVSFSWRDGETAKDGTVSPDLYFFEGKAVTENEYKEKTNAYFSIGNDKLSWYDAGGNKIN